MSPPRPTRPLRFGAFRFDPVANELAGPDGTQRLPLKQAELLLRLLQDAGQPVRRETLLDEVWERRFVNEEVLSRAIADLRAVLGDDARAPRYIETLPKVGYRFVATVSEATFTPAPGVQSAPPVSGHATPAPGVQPAPPASGHTAPAAARQAAERDTAAQSASAKGDLSLAPAAPSAVAGTRADPARPGARIYPARRAGIVALCAVAIIMLVALIARWPHRGEPPRERQAAALTAERLLHARPFTSDPGRELFPRFTPDAKWVVYTRFVPGGGPAHLRLRAVDGTEDRVLVQDAHENYCGAVSPDGNQLAWLRTRDGRCEVMLRDLRGGPAKVLTPCGTGSALGCPDYTRDGRELLLEGHDDARGLRAVAVADGTSRTLGAPPPGAVDLAPRATRDGRAVVFWRGDGNTRVPMQLSLQSDARDSRDSATPLADTGFLAFGHAFDRDGSLVTADDRFGQRALVRLGEAGPILLGATGARFPDIAANGAVVYEVAHYDANLWRIDLRDPAAPPRQLTRAARYDSQPALSPDAEWLAFGSNRDGREGVYLMRTDGRDERKLPLDPAQRWTSPAWSPDGTRLLVLRYTEREASVCEHVLASAATTCPPGLARNRSGVFYLAPGEFAAADESTRDAALWRHALDGGAENRIDTAGPVDRCRATPRWLTCHRPGHAGLWLHDRLGGETRTILPELDRDLRAWDLAGDAVWFPQGGAARGLYRHDLLTGTTTRAHEHVPTAIGDALAVAPDGRFAVLSRTDSLDVDLMYLAPAE